jgi:protease II
VFVAVESHTSRSILAVDQQAREVEPVWTAEPGERVLVDTSPGRYVLLRSGVELLAGDRAGAGGSWRTLATAREPSSWDDFAVTADAVFLIERGGGGQRLIRVGLDAGGATEVVFATGDHPVGGPASLALVPGVRGRDPRIDVVRGSWTDPDAWFRTSTDGRVAAPAGLTGLTGPGPAARDPIDVVRLSVESADGTAVPLTVLRPAGREGPIPTVLFAYGAYGIPVDPGYSAFRGSLLSRGIAFAIAHVRGGGDQGPRWHEAGRAVHKQRAVDDYLACAQALVERGWTSPDGLAARARSAGAAVVGAALNRDPARFAAAVLEVPFLDCLATLSDPRAPLTGVEWQEWGNPITDPAARVALAALSPVDNVRPAPYPPILLTAGTADVRVSAEEALRFADAVRAASSTGRPVLVKIDEVGHLGHSELTADHQDEADVLAFLIDQLAPSTADPKELSYDHDVR